MDKNKFLTYISLAVIVISLWFIGSGITGRVTDIGFVNITVVSSANINFTTDSIDFGDGIVIQPAAGALLHTNGSGLNTSGNWSVVTTNLTLENIGNVNLTLNISSDKDADAFIGGTSPRFQFIVTNESNFACSWNNRSETWTAFTGSGTMQTVCAPLDFTDSRDEIYVDVELYVPSDSSTGALGATITAEGTAV